jgi:hypothetical protein
MLIELFIFFEIVAIGLFIASFFTKQEILWAVTLVVLGFLMFNSFNVEYYVYEWNTTISAYTAIAITHSYPYLMGINTLFFVLALVLLMFDLFDKYGTKIMSKGRDE